MSPSNHGDQQVNWAPFALRMLSGVLLVTAGWLLFGSGRPNLGVGTSEDRLASQSPNARSERLVSLSASPDSEDVYTTRPIEQIRVGDRVLARNPQVSDVERTSWPEPDWRDWLHLSLIMPKEDGSVLKVELLRPESWVLSQLHFVFDPQSSEDNFSTGPLAVQLDDPVEEETDFDVDWFPLSPLRPVFRDVALTAAAFDTTETELIALSLAMDLPEMGATGVAIITDIRPCPPLPAGKGQPVTATFSHPPSTQVLNVVFEGESEPIGVTDNHLFWSVDRQQFLPIGKMEIGERVRTFRGETKRIEQQLPRPGPEVVYNLEVYGEHVYFVGEQGLLAHNSYSVPKGAKPKGVDFEGVVWRYEYPGRKGTTWTASKSWNVNADHRYTKSGIGGAYGGLTKATAKHEVDSYGALAGRVATQKKVKLSNVLDLRDPAVRKQLGVTLDDITRTGKNKYEITHVIGEWAKKKGYSGIIAPSAQFKGTPQRANLVSFEDL